jgi:hypothetical protein
MDEFIKIIIGISCTTLGGFLGYFIRLFIEHRLAIGRIKESIKITEFNKAAAEFKSTFVDEILRIGRRMETPHTIYGERLIDIAIANKKAKIIFEAFLPDDMLSGFNAAWEKYEDADIGENSPLTEEGRKQIANIYLSHINNLLKFAKPEI